MTEEEEKTEDSGQSEAEDAATAETDEQATGSEQPAEAEGSGDGDAEPAAEEQAGDDAAAPAPAAESVEDEEPVAELTSKQRRKLTRSTHSGEPAPELTSEQRQERREAERTRKGESRRRYRQGRGAARAKAAGKGSGTGTEPRPREPGNPKVRQGVVVSDKMDKTITVRVESARRHPAYEKVIRTSKMYHAHDERNEAGPGDMVRLVETRPMSRTKRWRLTEILEKAK